MDWSDDLVQWLNNILWSVLGFWGELISGESASTSDSYFDIYGASSSLFSRHIDPTDSAADASAQPFTGQGNASAYTAVNFPSAYADSSLSESAQLLAPGSLTNAPDTSSTPIFDSAFSGVSRRARAT